MKRGILIFIFLVNIILISFITSALQSESEIHKFSLGKQKFIVVYAYPDYITPANFDKQKAFDTIFGKANSVKSFWEEASFGQVQIFGANGEQGTINDVYGPLQLKLADCNQFQQAIIDALKPFNVLQDGLTIIVVSHMGKCPKAEAGYYSSQDFGTPENPLSISFAVDWTSEGFSTFDLNDIIHETGHALGLGHATYSYCPPDPLQSPEDCAQHVDHGNPFDIMGASAAFPESSAPLLANIGWLKEDPEAKHRVITITKELITKQNTFILKPLADSSGGLKAIRIPHGEIGTNNQYLYIEWRQPIGLDQNMFLDYKVAPESNVFNGAILNLGLASSILINPTDTNKDMSCRYPWIGTGGCPRVFNTALPYGQSYTDPNTGTTIKIGQPTMDGLPVTIEHLGRTDFTPPTVGGFHVVEYSAPILYT